MKLRDAAASPRLTAMFSSLVRDRESLLRVLRFLVVGGGTAVWQVAVIWMLKHWMSETAAFSLSWIASTAAHYLANRFWALPSARQDSARQFGEYLFTIAVSYAINLVTFKLCRGLGLPVEWATLCAIPPSTIVVFLLLNFRVFRAKG
jgi:putative flippase GtrA